MLELGAGTGIISLLATQWASHVDVTDYDIQEICLIRKNLDNFAAKSCAARAIKLDWNFPEEAEGLLAGYDVIFGSMLTFQKENILPLTANISRFLAAGGACFLYNDAVAHSTTFDEAWDEFHEGIRKNGLLAADVYADPASCGVCLPGRDTTKDIDAVDGAPGATKSIPRKYLFRITHGT